jgi:hypothetical protein
MPQCGHSPIESDPEFASQWREDISTEACDKLNCGDSAGSVMEYLREMAEQAERTQGIERTKTLVYLVERLLTKLHDSRGASWSE